MTMIGTPALSCLLALLCLAAPVQAQIRGSTARRTQTVAMNVAEGMNSIRNSPQPAPVLPASRVCQDNHPAANECPYWATNGECDSNPNFMVVHCQKSCQVCQDQVANDGVIYGGAGAPAGSLAAGGGGSNPSETPNGNEDNFDFQEEVPDDLSEFVTTTTIPPVTATTPPVTATAPPVPPTIPADCQDNRPASNECPYWARIGECESNPLFMHVHCVQSCGLCANTAAGTNGANPNGANPTGDCANIVYTDVVIIGAGTAGLSAAATLQEQGVDYVLVESTDRVGGRVRSTQMGVPQSTWTVEDGANWIYGNIKDNPILALQEATGFVSSFNDYYSGYAGGAFAIYFRNGTRVDPELYQQEADKLKDIMEKVEADVESQWDADHEFYNDPGVMGKLAENGWAINPRSDSDMDNIDWTIQWDWVDWEYAQSDVSVRFWPSAPYEPLLTVDPRGFEHLLETFASQNVNTANLKLNTRVLQVDYNEDIVNFNADVATSKQSASYKARVKTANSGTGQCTDYVAQRVISTVSAGVLNNDLIPFDPPLAYPADEYNPMEMGNYVKAFFQFENQFWDGDAEFIRVIPDARHRGLCHHWQNHNYEAFQPGSNILKCEIMHNAFIELLGTDEVLSEAKIDALLDPLRLAYGADVVGQPIDTYVTTLHLDADFGFGAYSSWVPGYTFTQYAQFYGGIEELVPYCQHNGCNDDNEWILIFAGAATCYDQAETVHGAFYSGQRSASFALKELGFDVKHKSPCDLWWGDLEGR